MKSEVITLTPFPDTLPAAALGAPDSDDGSARAVQRALASIGLETPSDKLLAAAGAALWLRFDLHGASPLLEGLHPNRLLRMCFALNIWALRSHLLSPNLVDFLRAHASSALPVVVDLDPARWLAGTPARVLTPAGVSSPRISPLRMVVTNVETTPAGTRIIGFGPDGEPGDWPAARVVAAARLPRLDAPTSTVTLHQLLVRRLQVDPPQIIRAGLGRVVGQMRQSIPDVGITGLAAFAALRQTALARVRLQHRPAPADLGRDAFAAVLPLAADVLARPALLTTSGRFAEAAEAWRAVSGVGRAAVPLLTELERLERCAIDEIAAALTPQPRVAVPQATVPQATVPQATVPQSTVPQVASAASLAPAGLEHYVHRRGVHCASMALHNLARHNLGQRWSEALCFGLAAGLNFTYLREPGSSMFLLMGRGSDMEEHFADAVGAHLETFRSDDDDLAFEHLLCQLDAGRLVVLEVDMFHLPYMLQSLELMQGVHFGGHKLFVTGHDPVAGTVTVYDYAWKEPIVLTVAQLRAARGSRDCPEPPRNGCFVFHFPTAPTPLDEAIPRALRTLVQQMRHPFMQWNGLPAIDRFCRQVARWGRVMAPDELALNARLASFMFERAGTGGGNFRNLYHRFLRQAATLLDAPELAAVAGHYRRLAAAWREVAALLDEGAGNPARGMFDPARRPQVLLDEIRHLERRAVDEIDTFLQGETQQ